MPPVGGLTFGGSIRLDHQDSVCSIIDYNDDGTIDATDVSDADTDGDINAATSCSDTGASDGSAGSVFVEGAFGKISMGDVSGAAEADVAAAK